MSYRIIPAEYLPSQLAVTDIRNSPPATPVEGERYIVGSSAAGAWIGMFHRIATYMQGVWVFDVPAYGWRTYVSAKGKEYLFMNGVWSVSEELSWGMDYQMEKGKYFFHRSLPDQNVEKDLRMSVDTDSLHPYPVWEWRNKDYWQREIWQTVQQVTPGNDVVIPLSIHLDEFFAPFIGELPDKGFFIEAEIQFWVNHYYQSESDPPNGTFHRTLTAFHNSQISVLRTALGAHEEWFPGGLNVLAAGGSWVNYESYPILYQSVLGSGSLDWGQDPFIISIDGSGDYVDLRIANHLDVYSNWEHAPQWSATVQVRLRMKEMSTYDRTNEIVG